MKNMNRKIAALALAGTLATVAHPLGGVVLDPTNLIQNIISASNSLGQLAGIIEQVNKAKATYDQLKESVKKLTDLDQTLLNELTSLLQSEQQAYNDYSEYYTKKNMSYNGASFSFADLFADGDGDGKNGMGDLMTFINQNISGDLASSIENITKNISPKQKTKIMKDYGMTPESYIKYKATQNESQKIFEEALGRINPEAWEKARNDNLEKIQDMLEKSNDASGEMQVLQTIANLNANLSMNITELNESILKQGAYTAYKNQLDLQKAEAQEKQEAYQRKRALTSGVMVDSNF